MRKLVWHTDAGHEWMAVPIRTLVEWGIAHDISAYSYWRGGTAYLEGDCDAGVFLRAAQARGIGVETREGKHWDRSPIRGFDGWDTWLTLNPQPVPETRTVISLMSGKPVDIPADTPMCCDPSTETYWSQ